MIRNILEARLESIPSACGGRGLTSVRHLLDDELLPYGGTLIGQVTLAAGAAIGDHVHEGEMEVYSILSGSGLYLDDQRECPVAAGDCTFTPSGHRHGLKNTGEDPLVFLACIFSERKE